MTELETNWDGLATHLGVTRTFITSVRKGDRNLGPEPLKKLVELEKATGMFLNGDNITTAKQPIDSSIQNIPFCAECAKKDKQNQRLRELLMDSTKRETQLADQVALLHKHLDAAFSIINTDRKNPAK